MTIKPSRIAKPKPLSPMQIRLLVSEIRKLAKEVPDMSEAQKRKLQASAATKVQIELHKNMKKYITPAMFHVDMCQYSRDGGLTVRINSNCGHDKTLTTWAKANLTIEEQKAFEPDCHYGRHGIDHPLLSRSEGCIECSPAAKPKVQAALDAIASSILSGVSGTDMLEQIRQIMT